MPAETYSARRVERQADREARSNRLATFGYKDYAAYIASPRWAAIRTRYRASSELPQACVLCGATEPIVLHHRTYERVCEERLEDLVPLCPTCHSDVHALEQHGLIGLGDVEALRSRQRADEYRPVVEKREQRLEEQRLRVARQRLEEDLKRRVRRTAVLLRGAVRVAASKGLDIEDSLAQIEDAVKALDIHARKTSPPPPPPS